MVTLPEGITQAELDEYAKLDAGIKKLQTRHKALNVKIKKAFDGHPKFTSVFGSVLVKVTEAASFDAKSAEIEFPLAIFPEYYKSVLDPAQIPADEKAKFTSQVTRLSVEVVD